MHHAISVLDKASSSCKRRLVQVSQAGVAKAMHVLFLSDAVSRTAAAAVLLWVHSSKHLSDSKA